MPEKIAQLNEEAIKGQLKELVRRSVEETLNGLLEAESEYSPSPDGMNAVNSDKDTEAVIIIAVSRQLPEKSRCKCRA